MEELAALPLPAAVLEDVVDLSEGEAEEEEEDVTPSLATQGQRQSCASLNGPASRWHSQKASQSRRRLKREEAHPSVSARASCSPAV